MDAKSFLLYDQPGRSTFGFVIRNQIRLVMNNQFKICQSCGMPLDKDPNQGGSNADQSKSTKYCSYCYRDGKFSDEGITLHEKIEKNIQMAVTKMNIPECQAREMAERLLPQLERWKK
jgi:hypothetical protein